MTLDNGLELTGIHHVSAITANAVLNRDFYTRLLGLRLVKKTVNQDATDVYHLFYADEQGAAGTDLTFFEIPHSAPNIGGSGEINEIALRIHGRESLEYWMQRFDAFGVPYGAIEHRAGLAAVTFTDPEGQRLALIDEGDNPPIAGGQPWNLATVPVQFGIRGLGAVTITTARPEPTLTMLRELMGFRIVEDVPVEGDAGSVDYRLETGAGGPGGTMIVRARPGTQPARQGRGGVHHVAFRVPTFEAHDAWNAYLRGAGIGVTPVIDRFYFRAMYFREPGGVLYEISTDGPGFADDRESLENLGEQLALPPFLEPQRAAIEAHITPLETSKAVLTAEYERVLTGTAGQS